MSVEVTESPTLGRVVEFHADDAPGAEAEVFRAAAEWLESPDYCGPLYDEWIVTGVQIAGHDERITLQVFILPIPTGQSVEDALGQ